MSLQQGRGAGCSGLIDMIVDGIGTTNAVTYACRVYGWDWEAALPVIDRTGRSGIPTHRLGDFKGHGSAEGEVQIASPPFPDLPKYARGTLTLQQNAADGGTLTNGVSFPIRISGLTFNREDLRDKTPSDLWQTHLNWVMDGAATITWGGHQVVISAATQNLLEVASGITKTYDPSDLRKHARQRLDAEGIANNDTGEFLMLATYIATATAPGTGLKVVDASFHKTDSAGGYFDITWDLRNTTDNTIFPHVHSSRASETPFIDTTAGVYNYTGNAATLSNLLWNGSTGSGTGFQSIAFAKDLNVTPIVDGKYLVVYEYRNPGATLTGTTRSGASLLEASMSGSSNSNGTAAQLYVTSNLSYGTSRRLITLSRCKVHSRNIRRFVLFRQLTGTTIPDAYPTTINGVPLPPIGTVNNAPFLAYGGGFWVNTSGGLTTGTVIYQGAKYKVNLGLTQNGNMPIAIGYEFYQDSAGIIENVPQSVFVRDIVGAINDTNTAPHWQYASVLGYPDIALAATGSFTAFTSGI